MTKDILVYGWYHNKNIGDDLFADAFKQLFPMYNFIFTNFITINDLSRVSCVFLGGGSFLSENLSIEAGALPFLMRKNVFYLGVGVEANINPIHLELMKIAKLLAIRSPEQLERIKNINSNTILIPDLVYSLQSFAKVSSKKNKSILILPNISVVPRWNAPSWKNIAWEYFKSEFAQFLDFLYENEYSFNFFSMCQNHELNDDRATAEIVNKMLHRDNYQLVIPKYDVKSLTEIFSEYSLIITQRYHGVILSDLAQTPSLVIHHHDKLKFADTQQKLSYYGISKDDIIARTFCLLNEKYTSNILNSDGFAEFQNLVITIINNSNSNSNITG